MNRMCIVFLITLCGFFLSQYAMTHSADDEKSEKFTAVMEYVGDLRRDGFLQQNFSADAKTYLDSLSGDRVDALSTVVKTLNFQEKAMDLIMRYAFEDAAISRIKSMPTDARLVHWHKGELDRNRQFIRQGCPLLIKYLDLKKRVGMHGYTYAWFRFQELISTFGASISHDDARDSVLVDFSRQRNELAEWFQKYQDVIKEFYLLSSKELKIAEEDARTTLLAEKTAQADEAFRALCLEEGLVRAAKIKKKKVKHLDFGGESSTPAGVFQTSPVSAVAETENALRCDVEDGEAVSLVDEEFDFTSAFVRHAVQPTSPKMHAHTSEVALSPKAGQSPKFVPVFRYDRRVLNWHIDPINMLDEHVNMLDEHERLNPASKKYIASENGRKWMIIEHRVPLIVERLQKYAQRQEDYSRKYPTRKNTLLLFNAAIQALGETRFGFIEIVIDTHSGAVYHRLFKECGTPLPIDLAAEIKALGNLQCKRWMIDSQYARQYAVTQSENIICITDNSDLYDARYIIFKSVASE